MFKHILVPLDGSVRAERALPLAASLARSSGGTISLLRVVSLNLEDASAFHAKAGIATDEVRVALVQEAKEYLERVAHTELLAGITVCTHLVSDVPAQAILIYAQAEDVDLILLCSHGYNGFTRWALGSVAHSVARHSLVPVLVLQEKRPEALPEMPRSVRALIVLDGSSFAEAAIAPAVQLISAFTSSTASGEIHLMKVIKLSSDAEDRHRPGHNENIRQLQWSEAKSYLDAVKERFACTVAPELNLQFTCSTIEERDLEIMLHPSTEKGREKESQHPGAYDVIVVAIHGKRNMKHDLIDSVAERMLEKANLPLMVVRPEEAMLSVGH